MGISGSNTRNGKEKEENKRINKEENIAKGDKNGTKRNGNLVIKRQELFTDHLFIPIEITNKVIKSVCKITIKKVGGIDYDYGTGFFMNLYDSKKYLITNYHVISENTFKDSIEIEIYNLKKMYLKFDNRYIKFIPEPIDIVIIEIKMTDKIYNDIELLDYDMNYKKGYKFYKNLDIFSVEYPYGKHAVTASGKIKDINDYEFEHTIPTDSGSSGCPILLLLNNNINLIQVIGIHKEADYLKKVNIATFIGEIFNEDNNYMVDKNCIKDDNINKDINTKIINTHEEKNNKNDQEIKKENIDKEQNNSILNNEIICIYNKKDKKISLLHDFTQLENWPDKFQKCYIEGKNNINEKNIEIFINDKKSLFKYNYKNDKKGKIKVKFKFNNLLTSTFCMFYKCSSLESVDLSSFNVTNIKDMGSMFRECHSLKSINLSSLNTFNVINMGNIFDCCFSIKSIDLSYLNTINVESMCYMFFRCSALETINLTSFNTTNVNNMCGMFEDCVSLKSIDLSSFNTKNVKEMVKMFFACHSLKEIDLSSFNTSNVSNMEGQFGSCVSLDSLDLSSFDTSKVTNMSRMFDDCETLKNINLLSFNTRNVTDMYRMFSECSSLRSLDLSSFDTSNVTNMMYMFNKCSSLNSLDLSSFDTSKVTCMGDMFYECSSLNSIDLSSFDTSNVTNMSYMFYECSSLNSIDLSSFNTINVKNMGWMFCGCFYLFSINLSSFNTKNVEEMSCMFENCPYLNKQKVIINTSEKKIFNKLNNN